MSLGINTVFEVARILMDPLYYISNLDLSSNGFGDQGAKLLSNAIGKSLTLVHVDLSSNDIGKEGAEILFEKCKRNQAIVCLNIGNSKALHRNFLCGNSIHGLSEMLEFTKQLTFLDLKGASIGNEGLKVLLEGLKKSKSLMVLNLSFNLISSQANKLVCELMGKSSVKRLDLSQNNLNTKFGLELLNFTYSIIFLQTHLNFGYCGFTHRGITKFIEAIRKDTCLIDLNLDGCRFFEDELFCLSDLISHNGSLHVLSLKSCALMDRGVDAIIKGFPNNMFLTKLYLASNQITVFY